MHVVTSGEDPLYAFGAARGELSSLRHRAFMADDAVRNLTMNLTGLRASVQQAKRSLERLEKDVSALREQAVRAGINPEHVPNVIPRAQDRLFAFLGRARKEGGDRRE